MANPAKRKGTALEVACRDYLIDRGWPAARLAPAGSLDAGDIGGMPLTLECKATRSLDLAAGLTEAKRESVHAGKRWYACIFKRRQHSVSEAYAVLPLWVLCEILEALPSA